MVCAGVRITRTGEEWAPSPGVTCSLDGARPLHGKPVRWLRAETVSGGSSARRVNVVIDRGRRCRHRGFFPLFSAPGHVGEERHPTGHGARTPVASGPRLWRVCPWAGDFLEPRPHLPAASLSASRAENRGLGQ